MRSFWLNLGLVVALLATACAPAVTTSGGASPPTSQGSTETRDEDQSLNIAVKGLFGNPTPQSSATLFDVYYALYDDLTHLDENYNVKPWIATSWKVSEDLLTWTFKIRGDMKWPDGSKLTADDVAFSLKTVRELKWPQIAYFRSVESERAVDPTTVEITTSTPDMSIAAAATYLWIIPKAYFEKVGFDGFVTKPMGSGPYELVDFQVGTNIEYKLRSEPHAFRKPVATTLNIDVVPENSQIVNGLQTGAIDVASGIPFSGEQADQVKQAGISVFLKSVGVLYVMAPQGSAKERDTPLQDVRVRQAISYAIDREGLSKKLFGGYNVPTGQVAIPDTLYYDSAIKPFPYDPKKAKALLAEAGYPNGFTLPIGLDYTPAMTLPDFTLAIQGYLKDVGIDTPVINNERALFVDKAYGRNNTVKGDLWSASQGDPIGFGGSRTFIGCGKPTQGPPSAENYCNPQWDKLMDQAYAEPNEAKRATLLKQANHLQVDDAVYIGVVTNGTFTAYTSKVRGIETVNTMFYNYDSVYKVK